jgi:phage/plasmid-like protein (TIGR03299 family)
MAHMLAQDTNGVFQFAFRGQRTQIWHGHGQQMEDTATADDMLDSGGWNFKIVPTRVRYYTDKDTLAVDDDNVVQLHSVTKHRLGITSSKFEPAQPAEMRILVKRMADALGGRVDTVGVTHDGAGLFANIQIGEAIRIVGTDILQPNMLIHTMNDGSAQTRGKSCLTRAVCNNTVQAALGEGKHVADMRLSHRSEFDGARVAAHWTAAIAEQRAVAEQFKMLAQTPVSHRTADELIFSLFNDKRADSVKENAKRDIRNGTGYKTILGLFSGAGMGSTMPGVKGTAWGLFNSVTEYLDHHVNAKNDSIRWTNANLGSGADMKDAAFRKCLELAMAD